MRSCTLLRRPWSEPIAVLAAFADEPQALALLSGGGGPRARWSYVARRPARSLILRPEQALAPVAALRDMLGPLAPGDPDGPPFQGGLAGLATYEMADRLEPLGLARLRDWPDLACGLYLSLLAFDHERREVLAIGRGADRDEADRNASAAAGWLGLAAPLPPKPPLAEGFAAETSDADYAAAAGEVVGRIAAGEIFQANIARRWSGRLRPGRRPLDLLARLCASSPAPFAAYYRLERAAVVSNSPERFLRVEARDGGFKVETRPIKGTRPRGRDPAEDRRLAADLADSAKDRAENLMIVDLMRNDLSRVCDRVETLELFTAEAYANVHHLVSTVVGRVKPGLAGLDVFEAAFPPGSVTGAPKIQAMKVIAELEAPRGPYCGSMFWAGFDGAFDSSVLIRTAVCELDGERWRIEAKAGAGVVADSDPVSEARETSDKIAAISRALEEEVA